MPFDATAVLSRYLTFDRPAWATLRDTTAKVPFLIGLAGFVAVGKHDGAHPPLAAHPLRPTAFLYNRASGSVVD